MKAPLVYIYSIAILYDNSARTSAILLSWYPDFMKGFTNMMPRAAYPYLSALKIEILNPSYTLSMLSIAINNIRRRAAAPAVALIATTRRASPSIFILNSSPLRCVNSHHCMSTMLVILLMEFMMGKIW